MNAFAPQRTNHGEIVAMLGLLEEIETSKGKRVKKIDYAGRAIFFYISTKELTSSTNTQRIDVEVPYKAKNEGRRNERITP